MADNFNRMIQLVTSFFDVKNDPDQLDVNEQVIRRLQEIHPAALSEYIDGDGPVLWILIIPTTRAVMERFLNREISERGLYEETVPGMVYESIYLCSATVLPEYRRKGLAKKMTIDAINEIRKLHPVKTLFYWPFSDEGRYLAKAIAADCGLPLLEGEHDAPHGI